MFFRLQELLSFKLKKGKCCVIFIDELFVDIPSKISYMSQVESYRKFLTENLEKVVFLRYSGLLSCFLNFTMGGGMDFGRGITYI